LFATLLVIKPTGSFSQRGPKIYD